MAHLPPMRLKRSAVRVVVLVVALLGVTWSAPAFAARPVPGGRYLLTAPDPDSSDGPSHMGVLQVSRTGRALTSEGIPWSPEFYDYFGSYFEDLVQCQSARDDMGDVLKRMPISASGRPENRPVRIDRRRSLRRTGD